MNNFWVVFSHTYLTKIKSRQFILTTVITLLIILAMANITKIIGTIQEITGEDGKTRIALVDETNGLGESFKEILITINPVFEIQTAGTNYEELKNHVFEGELEAYIQLSLNDAGIPKVVYYSDSLTDFVLPSQVEAALQQLKTSVVASEMNLTAEELAQLNAPAEFETVGIGENVKSQEELSQARGLVYVLLFVMYFAVILYATMIATEVATEKSSRVMEILISSVHPVAQMFGKIFGVASVALTQLIIWLGAGFLAIRNNMEELTGGFFDVFGFENTSLSTIIYAIVFFLLGFLLYATIAAFLGSLVSRIEDANQVIVPLIWLVAIAFVLAVFGLGTPDAGYVTITSYIPFFTPMIMFMRVGLLDLPLWEPLLSIVLLVVTIILFALLGARVYKGGVLMYGRSNIFKDLKQALQLTKKVK